MTRPRIAVLMDENTSSGGTRYEAHKGYFHRLIEAGATPFGIPYDLRLVDEVVSAFDGLVTAGGRFGFPEEWYASDIPQSVLTDRLEVEVALLRGFLAQDKAVLGICAGMQTLAGLHGAKLDVRIAGHDGGEMHDVETVAGSRLQQMVGPRLNVNSYHREAIVLAPSGVVVGGAAGDGVVEAIEIPARRFAIGLQWHQELLGPEHPGQAIFRGFVSAAEG